MVAIVRLGADLPGGAVYLAGPPVWWVIGFYASLGVWLWWRGEAVRGPLARRVAIGWLAIPGALLLIPPGDGELRVTWLSVGHGVRR